MANLHTPGSAPPEGTPDPSRSSSFVQLHPKSKPSQKRCGEDLQDWDNIQTYFYVKRRKLRDQFEAMGSETRSNIFQGVTIYVNGWTQPRAEELKEMMHAHGGKYEFNLYSRSAVTHTIASNLPNSKVLKLGSSLVCKPSWIVDSIAAKKLLPVDSYLLYKPRDGGQSKLSLSKKKKAGEELEEEVNDGDELDEVKKKKDKDGDELEEEVKKTARDELEKEVKKKNASKELDEREAAPVDTGRGAKKSTRDQDSKASNQVNEFFAHSRLHYLSTWSTELKQFTAEMLGKVTPWLPRLPDSASLKALGTRAVVHIDLDCFFVSVSIRDKPHLRGKPVAVTHAKLPQPPPPPPSSASDVGGRTERDTSTTSGENLRGTDAHRTSFDSTSDIASCSYEARASGVRNGMAVGVALKWCPDLVLLPYDFESYRQTSRRFYETLLQYSSVIEAVSCDEAYLELTDYCHDTQHVSDTVSALRGEVHASTGCTASAGVSHNPLLARMCTRVAKPNGQFYLAMREAEVEESFLASRAVSELPGVGYSTAAKLRDEMGVLDCGQLRRVPLERLQTQFGPKTGKTLHDYARGIDQRELKVASDAVAARKTVSVDINFGIRFKEWSEAESLLKSLGEKLERRAEQAQVIGGQLTLKLKIKKADAPVEPRKFLGHGPCDNVSRSAALYPPTRRASKFMGDALGLLKLLSPLVTDIRGVGLQLGKLASTEERGGGGRAGVDLRKMLKGTVAVEIEDIG